MIRWKLRVVMRDRKISATKLADLLGVHRVTVTNWANSDELPSFEQAHTTLDQICFHLNCTPADLIEYTRTEP